MCMCYEQGGFFASGVVISVSGVKIKDKESLKSGAHWVMSGIVEQFNFSRWCYMFASGVKRRSKLRT